MKKKILIALSYVLVVALAITGTIAYLTDTDEDVNVMTLGNVEIRQNEEQRVDPSKGGELTAADLEDFVQGKPLYPYVDENLDHAMGDDYEIVTFPDGNTGKIFIGDNAIDKFVSVTNTGKSDAYVRTIIALEAPTDKIDLAFNVNGWKFDAAASSNSIEVDGVKYDLFVCIYKETLKPGETTPYNLMQIALDWTATNAETIAYGNAYDVLVLSQAVQTAGFADAATALNAGFGEVTAEKAAEWFGGEEFTVPTVVSDQEELEAALAAIEDGTTIYFEDGEYQLPVLTVTADNVTFKAVGDNVVITEPLKNEYVWRFQGDNITLSGLNIKTTYNTGSWTNSITVEGDYFTMENCTVDGRGTNDQLVVISGKAGYATIRGCDFLGAYRQIGNSFGEAGTLTTIEGCTFGGNTSYAVHFDTPSSDLLVKDCVIKGHNAIGQNGNGNVVFDTVEFAAGDTYNQMALHRSVTFNNCTFSQGFALGMSKPDKTITFNGGTWEGWDSVKARVLEDSFGYNLTAVFDGETYAYTKASGWAKA